MSRWKSKVQDITGNDATLKGDYSGVQFNLTSIAQPDTQDKAS